jgi:hypothetical protein
MLVDGTGWRDLDVWEPSPGAAVAPALRALLTDAARAVRSLGPIGIAALDVRLVPEGPRLVAVPGGAAEGHCRRIKSCPALVRLISCMIRHHRGVIEVFAGDVPGYLMVELMQEGWHVRISPHAEER